jgi:hypothetical protein
MLSEALDWCLVCGFYMPGWEFPKSLLCGVLNLRWLAGYSERSDQVLQNELRSLLLLIITRIYCGY